MATAAAAPPAAVTFAPPASGEVELVVEGLPTNNMAYTSAVYVGDELQNWLVPSGTERCFVSLTCGARTTIHKVLHFKEIKPKTVAMSAMTRKIAGIDKPGAIVAVRPWVFGKAGMLEVRPVGIMRVTLKMHTTRPQTVEEDEMVEVIRQQFDHVVLHEGQSVVFFKDRGFTMEVTALEVQGDRADKDQQLTAAGFLKRDRGLVTSTTQVEITPIIDDAKMMTFKQSADAKRVNLVKNWKFSDMGIGGLDSEFESIVRRAFATRLYPASVIRDMGINHVRGVLLYGPPGTGKTLIARQIGKLLQGREPKVVNGPEILNKFVGQSEENIRNLFKDAEEDQKKNGDAADLHIIIFDELDAICRKRGSINSGTGVHDTIVNQILSKMDGVESLNNILIIGMTNRKDMIDDALLRPGRMEVHVEINLPDEKGRADILKIHTRKMHESGRLDPSVNLEELAGMTKNFSGAELEGLVRSAQSWALRPGLNVTDISVRADVDLKDLRVTRDHFLRALQECKAAFGVAEQDLSLAIRGGMYRFGRAFDEVEQTLLRAVSQVKNSKSTPLQTVLLEGPSGCGKTALAAHVALHSGIPLVKIVSPENYVGASEGYKVARINDVFEDAYRSPLSVVIVDSLERLLEYVPVGPRFSNTILQAIWVLVKKIPPTKGRRLLIIATTNEPKMMAELGIDTAFNILARVPRLTQVSEVTTVLRQVCGELDEAAIGKIAALCDLPLTIKTLLTVVEIARQQEEGVSPATFTEALRAVKAASSRKEEPPHIAHLASRDGDEETDA